MRRKDVVLRRGLTYCFPGSNPVTGSDPMGTDYFDDEEIVRDEEGNRIGKKVYFVDTDDIGRKGKVLSRTFLGIQAYGDSSRLWGVQMGPMGRPMSCASYDNSLPLVRDYIENVGTDLQTVKKMLGDPEFATMRYDTDIGYWWRTWLFTDRVADTAGMLTFSGFGRAYGLHDNIDYEFYNANWNRFTLMKIGVMTLGPTVLGVGLRSPVGMRVAVQPRIVAGRAIGILGRWAGGSAGMLASMARGAGMPGLASWVGRAPSVVAEWFRKSVANRAYYASLTPRERSFYNIGQLTLSHDMHMATKHLSPIQRGQLLHALHVARYGPVVGELTARLPQCPRGFVLGIGASFHTGTTPNVAELVLGIPPAAAINAQIMVTALAPAVGILAAPSAVTVPARTDP